MTRIQHYPKSIVFALLLTALVVALSGCVGNTPDPTPMPTATAVTILPTPTPMQAETEAETVTVAEAEVDVQVAAATDAPDPAPTDPPAAPTNTPEPLPPLLLESSPAQGSNWDGGPIAFTFDQPLAPESALAVTVNPDLPGSVALAGDAGDALVFTPAQPAQEGVIYTFRLGAEIASAQGVAMPSAEEVSLSLVTPLTVTNITPGDGNRDVATDSQITVIFNRPVVELVGVADQADLPQPLTLSPEVAGSGRWVSTSVFVFTPEVGMAGSTDYAVTVADLTAMDGAQMAAPVSFSFRTAAPVLVGVDVSGDMVRPDRAFTVQFSQPMDPASTEAAFSLTGPDGPVAGTFAWDAADTTFVFQPDEWLAFGDTYQINVSTDAQPASRQGNLRQAFSSEFSVVKLPGVIRTDPADGRTNVPTDNGVTVYFNAPLSQTLVLENIQISPEVTSTQVYSYYSDYGGEVTLSWIKEANSPYTVTIGADIADLYGNTLGEETLLRFTTGDDSSFTRINLDQYTHFSASNTPVVNAYYRNMDSLNVDLYQLPMVELDRLTGREQWQVWDNYKIPNPEENLIWSRPHRPDVGQNVVGEIRIELNDADGEPLTPGIYLLEMNSPLPARRSQRR